MRTAGAKAQTQSWHGNPSRKHQEGGTPREPQEGDTPDVGARKMPARSSQGQASQSCCGDHRLGPAVETECGAIQRVAPAGVELPPTVPLRSGQRW